MGRESKLSHFSSSWTKFSCFFFFCVSANAAASRPELSVFPRAFRARGCGGERVTLLFGRARLNIITQAREKAKIVIAERAKLNALVKKDEPQPETEPEAPPPPPSDSLPVKAPPEPEPLSESEDEEPRPKYRYVHGVGYIKIK